MFTGIEKIKYHSKKKTFGFKERNEEKRQAFLDAIEKVDKKELFYLDESGIDDNESYPYAWSLKGKRAFSKKAGHRKERINFIGALKGRKFKAPFMFKGHCDSKIFEAYLEECLVPELTPGTVVILDNAAFHKSLRARKIIESARCQIIFLPAYSPDLNPIEQEWFPIKNKIRHLLEQGEILDSAVMKTLKQRSEAIC